MITLPIDNLNALWPKSLSGTRVGAVLHPASVSATLRHSAAILKSADPAILKLTCLFGPQHGFLGQTQDNMIEWEGFKHPLYQVPVHSLYGDHRQPTADMLKGVDALLIDLQDVGARYYTFIWTLFLCMKACEAQNIPIIVMERPNPINGITVEGPVLSPQYTSFVGLHPIPVRHGKTIGQLATQFKTEAFPSCQLHILPMQGWQPEMWFDQTGLPWVYPSPNMPTLDTAIVYPGMCLIEGTNLSEGRGTTRPFELFGAPFIDASLLCRELDKLNLPGVYFRECSFQPSFHKFSGEVCGGAQIHVIDRDCYQSYNTGVEIIRTVKRLYPRQFQWKPPPYEYEYHKLPIEVLTGGPVTSTFPND